MGENPIKIDPSDPMPIYAQMERAIRFAILTGKIAEGDRLPTVRQLAVDLCVNANTVAKVYAELERAGVLETRRGAGTFVRPVQSASDNNLERLRALQVLADRFVAEAAALGISLEDVIAHLETRRI